jgi:fibronectin-binding autotransporter adhesin
MMWVMRREASENLYYRSNDPFKKPDAAIPMKIPITNRFLAIAALFSAQATDVHATSDSWKFDAAGNWVDPNNWLGGNVPGTGDTATFGNVTLTGNRIVTVDANRTISSIVFNSNSTAGFSYSLESGNLLLANFGSISVTGANTGNKAEGVGAAIALQGATASFSNDSTGATHTLGIGGTVTTSAASSVLTLNGTNTGTNTLGVVNGNIGIVKEGAGIWSIRFVTSNYNGGTEIKGGTLELYSNFAGFGGGAVTLNGGNVTLTKNASGNNTFQTNLITNDFVALQSGTIHTQRQNSGGGTGKNQALNSLRIANGATVTHTGWDSFGLEVTNATKVAGNVGFANNVTATSGQRLAASGPTTAQVAGGATLLLNTLTVDDSATTGTTSTVTFNGSTNTGSAFANTYVAGAVTNNTTDATKQLAITKQGSNILTLAGSNTYTGTTTISAGAVLLANANAVQNSTVSIGVANGLTFSSGIGTFNLGGLSGSSNVALVDVASSAVALSVGGNNAPTSYNGDLSGPGSLTKTGIGTMTLASTNTYSGTTTVSGGTLAVNGSIGSSATTVQTTGVVTGTGTLGSSLTVKSTGVVNAGSVGTINTTASVTGATTFESGSIFSWDLSSNGATGDKLTTGSVGGAGDAIFRVVLADGTANNAFFDTSHANFFADNDIISSVSDLTALFNTVQVYSALTNDIADISSRGSFTLTSSGVSWSAVPEPSSALAGLLIAGGLLRRRRGA